MIDAFIKGKDVFFCSPTGSGKSLTFELASFVFKYLQESEESVIIVVSPLSSHCEVKSIAFKNVVLKLHI